jgi:hypothetical protein
MQLIISRDFDPDANSNHLSPYEATFQLDLSEEERKLIEAYGLGTHVLTTSQYSATTVDDVIKGTTERLSYLDLLIGNEKALRNACAELPALLDYCRSFGSVLTVPL